jgi:integration host factor subunit alpha
LAWQVLKEIIDCLKRGKTVKLASFGTFLVRKRGSRPGRHPETGEDVLITPRRVILFKPSGLLVKRLAKSEYEGREAPSSAALEF